MFVPHQIRHELSCLSAQFAVINAAYKEVLKWLGLSVKICDAIKRSNYEERLLKTGLMRKLDRRKIGCLFKGWGDGNISEYESVIDDIGRTVGRKKIEFWRGRECKYRTEAFNSFDRIKDAIGNDRKVKRMLMGLKESMLDRE